MKDGYIRDRMIRKRVRKGRVENPKRRKSYYGRNQDM